MTTVGSFVPSLAFDGASVGMVLTMPEGRWSRDDQNKVEISLRVFVENKGLSLGYATIPNLPFPCADDTMDYPLTVSWRGIKLASGLTAVRAFVQRGSTVIGFALDGNAKDFVPLTSAEFISGHARLDIAGSYMAAP